MTGAALKAGAPAQPQTQPLTRWRAAGVHLLVSAAIAAGVLTLMLALWYPRPLFEAVGGNDLVLILLTVDVIVGPLLTLLVFKAGKRGLKFDLTAIGALQLAALLFGAHIIFLARPAFVVFVKDRFEVVCAVELAPERLAGARFAQFRRVPWTGPQIAGSDWPADPREQQKLVELAFAGEDLQHFPQYYAPYAERTAQILAKAQSVASVRKTDPASAKVIDDWLARSGTREQDVLYLPMRAPRAWMAVLVDPKTAAPVKMLIAEKL